MGFMPSTAAPRRRGASISASVISVLPQLVSVPVTRSFLYSRRAADGAQTRLGDAL